MKQNITYRCHPCLVSDQYTTVIDRAHFCSVDSHSADGKIIRTYVKNTLSRGRKKDIDYIKSSFMFIPEPESMSTVRSLTFGFFERTWSEERRAHNRSLCAELLAMDLQGFYTFLSRPLFQSVVSSFIKERGLDGKIDRHTIQIYVGVIVSSKLYSERPLLTQI